VPTTLEGIQAAYLRVPHNGSGSLLEVELRGRSVVSANKLVLGQLDSANASATFKIKNRTAGNINTVDVFDITTVAGSWSANTSCSTPLSNIAAECDVTVTLFGNIGSPGPKSATLNLKLSGTDMGGEYSLETVQIALSAVQDISMAIAPGVLTAADVAAFDPQAVSTTSAPKTLTLQNTASPPAAAVTLAASAAVTLGGPDAGEFALGTGSCNDGTSLSTAASCTRSITFTPTSPGKKFAYVKVDHNSSGSPRILGLSGIGSGATAALTSSRSALRFGSQMLGDSSPDQSITIRNVGGAAATSLGTALSGSHPSDFAVENNCPPSFTEFGPACTITVQFFPSSAGEKSATLTVSADGGVSTTVSLIGVTPGLPAPTSFSDPPDMIAGVPPTPPALVALNVESAPLGGASPTAALGPAAVGSATLVGPSTGAPATTPPPGSAPASNGDDAVCAEPCDKGDVRSIESLIADPGAGSLYRLVRGVSGASRGQQSWSLEYRSNTGALFARSDLPPTAEVSWRRADSSEALLPTTGWARVCADRVWTLQDGYELLAHVGDRALVQIQGSRVDLGADRDAAVSMSLISGAQCVADGGLRLQGYAFGVSDREPPLQTGPVAAREFDVLLGPTGAVLARALRPADFDVGAYCAAAANEQYGFCEAARSASEGR
jgi:hypothetical protein